MRSIITTIALLLSLPVMAAEGGLFPEQPVPMSPGYGANGNGAHAAVPEGVPSSACIVNPVSMQTGTREVTTTELVEGDAISIPTTLLFDFDGYIVRPQGRNDIQEVSELLFEGGATELRVIGHTDSRGTDEYNMELGLNRAIAVAAVLAALGFEDSEATSAGESEPLVPNAVDGVDSPEGRQTNRRVVIEVVSVAPVAVTTTVTERFQRNPQIFHVLSDAHSVSCVGNDQPVIFRGWDGYYPSYRIYGRAQGVFNR